MPFSLIIVILLYLQPSTPVADLFCCQWPLDVFQGFRKGSTRWSANEHPDKAIRQMDLQSLRKQNKYSGHIHKYQKKKKVTDISYLLRVIKISLNLYEERTVS